MRCDGERRTRGRAGNVCPVGKIVDGHAMAPFWGGMI